jgi:antitoxin MazE
MRISKWGNSLALRLPATLALEQGDETKVTVTDSGNVAVSQKPSREEALARLRAIGAKIPPDFKFNRDEADER